ncbi:DSD1 family PLP-dependent enzyme [Duganella sp. CY15W]|uniref:alanine racemase n=1 Tax=Duganella sp. CY15W TaxID=2692172 RepID=UPI001367E7FE|nr:alanine racemase [Duganella sp. CY15W]MYM27427.1 DSD1 family PLP-dependent enzyme [Duganella sp. CY15W]
MQTVLETPALLLDEARMQRNIQRMQQRMDQLGVAFRPHVKTSKCLEVARRQLAEGARGITVSTLKEAEEFFRAGVDDILYAVAIVPNKLDHALRLIREGLRLTLLLESVAMAQQVARRGTEHGVCYDVMIEIDTDGHRSGVKPDDPVLLEIAAALQGGARLKGVMTHAGASYDLNTPEALAGMAEQERSRCVAAAQLLRHGGHACEVVSVGSTPTALSARHLEGVTEVRAGVYVFFDMVMVDVGVCSTDDVAISVLCTVIGHQPAQGWVITDGGWMAMSRDLGHNHHGYGLVCDSEGRPVPELGFGKANQEHGVLQWRGETGADITQRFPAGSSLRVLPNHACATAAQHGQYHVIPQNGGDWPVWPRFSGW